MIRTLVAGALGAAYVLSLATIAADAQPRAATSSFAAAVIPSRLALFCPNEIDQSFPSSGPAVTSWRICWHEVAGNNSLVDPNGLVIGPVDFRTSPTAPWRRVIYDMRISDFFVPYHNGDPVYRFYDLSGYNFKLTTVSAADCPASAGGAPVSATVCKEVHDRGLLFKDFLGVKRGEELVLWGAINAANYRYIERYVFRDDGAIVAEEGATAQNLPSLPHEPHVHNAIWRIDLDVGTTVNDASLMQHVEDVNNLSATDPMTAIVKAAGFPWQAQTHDSIVVTDPSTTNGQGHNPSYHLVPMVDGGGLTRHHEEFTRSDFWVTPYDPTQMAASKLPMYISNGPPTNHRDVVVWYKGSLHHHPRDEDGASSGIEWKGTALVMYTGLMLMPNAAFDCTPFYGPCP